MKAMLTWILAGAIAGSPLLAAQEPQNPAQEPQPQEKPKPKPAPKPEPKPEKPKQEPGTPPQEPKPGQKQQKEQEKQQKEQSKQGKHTAQTDHARGQKIPEPEFRANFGKEHRFHVERSAAESRRFQYGGYWFEAVEVWPAGWSFNDYCYIEEDGDEYFIVDYIHPEFRVLVIVV